VNRFDFVFAAQFLFVVEQQKFVVQILHSLEHFKGIFGLGFAVILIVTHRDGLDTTLVFIKKFIF
jgi:hypothetical protein